jgi:uncharacterized DUF497 family protein
MITWDEAKRKINIRKHGIDLADLEEAFDSHMATEEDDSENYGELRLRSLAFWRGRSCSLSGPSVVKTLT